jgi:flagella basal body P-ring formation protein FlgA
MSTDSTTLEKPVKEMTDLHEGINKILASQNNASVKFDQISDNLTEFREHMNEKMSSLDKRVLELEFKENHDLQKISIVDQRLARAEDNLLNAIRSVNDLETFTRGTIDSMKVQVAAFTLSNGELIKAEAARAQREQTKIQFNKEVWSTVKWFIALLVTIGLTIFTIYH